MEVNDGSNMRPRNVRHYIEQRILSLPSDIDDYKSQDELVRDIISFVHRYAEVPPFWEELIAHYILMTWVFDRFTAVPYLRFLGEPGTGKTRIQQVCGRVCYKPTFVAGSISAAGIFRLSDAVRGTLVIDEGDFRNASDWSDIIKVLNMGYMPGASIIRCEEGAHGRFEPRGYVVFGPKVISSRNRFDTDALETRCLTLQTTRLRLRRDIPLQLPTTFEDEALALRNRLLKWRFDTFRLIEIEESNLRGLESRVGQIGTPIYSVSNDAGFRERFLDYLTQYDQEARQERPAAIVIKGLLKIRNAEKVFVNQVANEANLLCKSHGEDPMTDRKVGGILRSLGFKTHHTRDGNIVAVNQKLLESLTREYLPDA